MRIARLLEDNDSIMTVNIDFDIRNARIRVHELLQNNNDRLREYSCYCTSEYGGGINPPLDLKKGHIPLPHHLAQQSFEIPYTQKCSQIKIAAKSTNFKVRTVLDFLNLDISVRQKRVGASEEREPSI
jgi:hypothetical protein